MDAPPASVLVGQPGGAIRQPTMQDLKAFRIREAHFRAQNKLPAKGFVMFKGSLPFAWDPMPTAQNYEPGVVGLCSCLAGRCVENVLPEGRVNSWEMEYLTE